MQNVEEGKRDSAESYYVSTLLDLGENLRQRRLDLGIESQAEMAELTGLGQSTISRIEAGKVPKVPPVLRLVAKKYRIDEGYLSEVVFGFRPTIGYYHPLLVAYRIHADKLYRQRVDGKPQSTIGEGLRITQELRQAIRQVGSSETKLIEGLGDILVSVLNETGWAYSESSGFHVLWLNGSPVARLLLESENEFGIPELAGLRLQFEADSLYVGGQFQESRDYAKAALKHLTDLNNRLQMYKTMTSASAYLKDDMNYSTNAQNVWKLLNSHQYTTDEMVGSALQGLMRGAVMLDMPVDMPDEARKASEEFRRVLKTLKAGGVHAPLRNLLYLRAELERVNRFKKKKSEGLLRAASSGQKFAQKQYPRLAGQIYDALEA